MGHSSFAGGSLEQHLLMKLGGTSFFALFFMLRPMIPLTFSIAVSDVHTRLTHLETNATVLAAIDGRMIEPLLCVGGRNHQDANAEIICPRAFSVLSYST